MLETWAALPPLARLGLTILAAGLVLDVSLHSLGAAVAPEHAAHAVMLAGMVAILAGVIGTSRTHARGTHSKGVA